MRVVNIVDTLDIVNFGVWNAAISTSNYLYETYGIRSEIWFPKLKEKPEINSDIELIELIDTSKNVIDKLISARKLDPSNTIIHTHGCWKYPSIWGNYLSKKGYKWIYCPQGMLEPWSLNQKKIKKSFYYTLVESRFIHQANVIRAVSSPELKNLNIKIPKHLHKVLIPNGISDFCFKKTNKIDNSVHLLYMSRLHHKKSVTEMVEAWISSNLSTDSNYYLTIAGPDQGELEKINHLLQTYPKKSTNIKYIGSIYGVEKISEMKNSDYFILPSKSEGFPSSVLEAMGYGLIPIISEGCNFPELFDENLAIKVSPKIKDIVIGLNSLKEISKEKMEKLQYKNYLFVKANYSIASIGDKQTSLYKSLLLEH